MSGVDEKLDKILEDLSEIKVVTAVNTAHLEEHIRRTDLLETRVEQVATSIQPLKSHVDMVKGAVKLITICGIIASILGVLLKFLHH